MFACLFVKCWHCVELRLKSIMTASLHSQATVSQIKITSLAALVFEKVLQKMKFDELVEMTLLSTSKWMWFRENVNHLQKMKIVVMVWK